MIRIGVRIFAVIVRDIHVINLTSLSNFNLFNRTFLMRSFNAAFLINHLRVTFVLMNDWICKRWVILWELSTYS